MSKKIGQDFMCKVNYMNPMPDLPFAPKLVEYPMDKERNYKYQPGIQEKPLEMYGLDDDLGVNTDFISMGFFEQSLQHITVRRENRPNLYDPPAGGLDERDKPLLIAPVKKDAGGKQLKARPVVPWLRRTEYISSEMPKQGRSGADSEKAAASKPIDRSKEGQIRAIEKTFDTVSDNQNLMRTIRHPTNKSLTAVEVFPIYPDWTSWPNKYTHAVFDANPIGSFASHPTELDNLQTEECLLKPAVNPRNPRDKYLSMFVPDGESIEKLQQKRHRREEEEEEEEEDQDVYTYSHLRDFDYEMREEDEKKKMFMIVRPKVAAFYHLLESKVMLKRKRAKGRTDRSYRQYDDAKISKIMLRRRQFTDEEKKNRVAVAKSIAFDLQDLE